MFSCGQRVDNGGHMLRDWSGELSEWFSAAQRAAAVTPAAVTKLFPAADRAPVLRELQYSV